jgi:hypothetical protein
MLFAGHPLTQSRLMVAQTMLRRAKIQAKMSALAGFDLLPRHF